MKSLSFGILLALAGCTRTWGTGELTPDASTSYDAAVGIPFEGPLLLDDSRVMGLNPESLPGAQSTCGQPMLVRVHYAVDGDTLRVDEAVENGVRDLDVRLIGVNCPEIAHEQAAQCFGDDAHTFTKQLEGHYLYLTFATHCKDTFNRTLAYVHLGPSPQDFFQRQLLQRGFARTYFEQDNPEFQSLFAADQQIAENANVGLWGACE